MNHSTARQRAGGGLLALLLLAAGAPVAALPVLSEVFYDATGTDEGLVFVELYGAPGTSLDGLVVEGRNGSGGGVTVSLALSGVIPADGVFVVADDAAGGGSAVPEADLVLDFDFQNGPDSVVLLDGGTVLDALGYGDFGPGDVFAGEGGPAPDPPAGASLARVFADIDTDDNALDFQVLSTPTPGEVPLFVPEPATAGMLLVGMLGLGGRAAVGRAARPPAP